jgi:hypothetical protein
MKVAVLWCHCRISGCTLLDSETNHLCLHATHDFSHARHLTLNRVEGGDGVRLQAIEATTDDADVVRDALPDLCFFAFVICRSGEGVVLSITG